MARKKKLTITGREIDILSLLKQKVYKYQHLLDGCKTIEKIKFGFIESEDDYDEINAPGHRIFRINYKIPMLTVSGHGFTMDICLSKLEDTFESYLNNEFDYYKLELILEKFFMTMK